MHCDDRKALSRKSTIDSSKIIADSTSADTTTTTTTTTTSSTTMFLQSIDPLGAFSRIYFYIRIVGCLLHNLYGIPAYCLLNVLLLPLYYIALDSYVRIENTLYNWLLYIVSSWSWCAGLVVHEHGDDIYPLKNDPNVRLLVIANHQSTADVPLMMQAFTSRSEYILLWIMDAVFKWTNFGLVSQVHGDYFLNTKAYKNGRLLEHCSGNYAKRKNLFVLFPEGGFRYKRQSSSNSFAAKKQLPLLTNVTYPRFGAYSELIDPTLGVTHVVDLTICYDDVDHPPSILDILGGRNSTEIHFYYRIFSLDTMPETRTEEWLRALWQSKDRLLATHYDERRRHRLTSSPTTALKSACADRHSVSRGGSISSNGKMRSYSSTSSSPELASLKEQEISMFHSSDSTTHNTRTSNHDENAKDQILTTNHTITKRPLSSDLIQLEGAGCRDNDSDSVTHEATNNLAVVNDRTTFDTSNGQVVTRTPTTSTVINSVKPGEDTQNCFTPAPIRFDRTAGRAVQLCWTKLLLIHTFYIAICIAVFEIYYRQR